MPNRRRYFREARQSAIAKAWAGKTDPVLFKYLKSVAEPMEALTNMHIANFYVGAILEP